LLFTFQMIHQVLSPVIAFSIKHTSLSAAGWTLQWKLAQSSYCSCFSILVPVCRQMQHITWRQCGKYWLKFYFCNHVYCMKVRTCSLLHMCLAVVVVYYCRPFTVQSSVLTIHTSPWIWDATQILVQWIRTLYICYKPSDHQQLSNASYYSSWQNVNPKCNPLLKAVYFPF
jgi:hypothetical protein